MTATRSVLVLVAGAPAQWWRQALEPLGVTAVRELGGELEDELLVVARELASGGRVLLVDSAAVVSTAALARLVDDPSVGTALLVAPEQREAAPVRAAHGRVLSAGTVRHDVTGAQTGSLGVLTVGPRDAAAARAAVEEMARCTRYAGWAGDVVDHTVVALVRRGVPVSAIEAPGPAVRSPDPAVREELARRLEEGADERALRESGNRTDDGFYSTFVLRRLSKPLTETAVRRGLSPNQVSLASFAVGLGAAALFAVGDTGPTVVAALLLQLSLVLDCVDGEVARRTRRFSQLGAWLDASTDRVKEFAVYAGLATAVSPHAWALAGVVLTMQTFRHMTDYDFQRVQLVRETHVPARDLDVPGDGGGPEYGSAVEASRRAGARSWVHWAKKAVHMPIGERWLVISVGSVAVGPRATLWLLLALGLLAIGYTALGRTLRVVHWRQPHEDLGRRVLLPQLDLGPVGRRLWRSALGGPVGWLAPAALRLVELGALLGLTHHVAPEAMGWAYALAFVLAYHHYDTLYRTLGGSVPPRWLVDAGLGVEARLLVLVVLASLGADVLTAGLVVALVALAAWFVVVGSVQVLGDAERSGS